MGIANGLGVTGYRRTQSPPSLLEGAPADFETPVTIPMRNALAAQANNLAIGTYDTDTDAVGADITLPDGTVVSHSIVRAAGAPANATAAAVALAAAINGDDALVGHVEATASTTNVALAFLHENVVYPIDATASAGTTNTLTESQAPGGDALPFGRFVAQGATRDGVTAMRALTAADTEDDIVGVTMRPIAQFPNAGSELASAVDGIPAGKMGDVGIEKRVAMRNNGSVASTIGGPVHAVIATTGGDELGEARADADGGTQVATITAIADHQVYAVKAVVRVDGELRELEFQYGPTDGTTAAADAVDGLEAAAAAAIIAQGFTGIVAASAASGDPTFTLTAAAGYVFESVDGTAFGEDTEAEALTVSIAAAANYTIQVPRNRARWAEVVAPGAVGALSLHMI